MTQPLCPNCGRDFTRRSHREGLFERLISLFYVYPFRCQLCTHRFLKLQFGQRYVKQKIDRREYERIETKFPLAFKGERADGEGITLDVSMAGCAVETDAKLPEGSLVQLELKNSPAAPVEVEAAVIRSTRQRTVGLQFLRLREEERERLRQFIRQLLQSRRSQ
jgi:hypothetical protein